MLVDLKLDVSQTQTLSLVVFQFVQGKRTECVVIEVLHDFPHTYSMNTSLCLNNMQAFPFVMIALHLLSLGQFSSPPPSNLNSSIAFPSRTFNIIST